MNPRDALELRAGPEALAQLHERGLRPADIACVPAAAGGPKGLGLIPLDHRLFDVDSGWLRGAPHVELVGASIGAWRMAAAASADPRAALQRLSDGYVAQRYSRHPSPREVSDECRKLARAVLGGEPALRARDGIGLSLITARARGVLHGSSARSSFARAAFDNALGRARLAAHLERVVFHSASARLFATAFDEFGLERVPLDRDNSEDALLASGSIPLVCDPVRNPANAPRGDYWDGGLIDYHLLLPYGRLMDRPRRDPPGLVLCPHFVPHVTPGWLDKHLPWRARPRAHAWLDNMLLIAPSHAQLERLPNRKLPDRNDFHRYGQDHAWRERDWRRAIAECERFADAARAWLDAPDPSRVRPI